VEFETTEVVQIDNVTVTEMTEEGLLQFTQQAEDIAALEAGVVLDLSGDIMEIEGSFVDRAGTVERALGIGGLD